ncbi:hypothetical protein [Picosynechococcus sp. NKBG042902]|uniref:hypothetical protein n=1 Tax=Picosynechococcus sp. NKBG042902 TaxID=490193 RepID=UPI00126971A3|nr:hypothetical protein [Picosynechococcus sp. NKBG042902]
MTVSAHPYIQLDQEQLTPPPQSTLCHGVLFVLDHDALLQLLALKNQGQTLTFTDEFNLTWRKYVLFREGDWPQASLSFLLRYEGINVLKTQIGLDGGVLHQVVADLLPSPSLYQQLAEIQGWFIGQLLTQLPWRQRKYGFSYLAWPLAIAFVFISVILGWSTLMMQPLLWILVPIVLGLLGWGLQTLLRQWRYPLKRWLLSQVLYGRFAQRDRLRNWGLRWLHYL